MRAAIINKLIKLAKKNKDFYLITADTGFKVLDRYKTMLPKKFLNVGISESAMIGMASGLALSNKTVFVYAIIPFLTMRCFEQIRNDLCFQKLPVKLIGIGEGLTYGAEGATHHSIEDIAIMSALPNMTVVCPGDPIEAAKAIEASLTLKGPLYLRIGKSGEKIIHKSGISSFRIGRGITIRKGKDIAIIATGNMLETAVDVYDILKNKGIEAELVSMHTVKPLDRQLIRKLSKRHKIIITIEEHSVIGGLGSQVSNVLTDEGSGVILKKIAIPDLYADVAGTSSYLRSRFGLEPKQIAGNLLRCLKNKHLI